MEERFERSQIEPEKARRTAVPCMVVAAIRFVGLVGLTTLQSYNTVRPSPNLLASLVNQLAFVLNRDNARRSFR